MIGSRICCKNTFIRTIYIIEGEISNCQIKLQLELLYNCFSCDSEAFMMTEIEDMLKLNKKRLGMALLLSIFGTCSAGLLSS